MRVMQDMIFGDVGLLTGIGAASTARTSSPLTKIMRIDSADMHSWLTTHSQAQLKVKTMGAARLKDTMLFRELEPNLLTHIMDSAKETEVDANGIIFDVMDETSPICLV